MGGIPLTGGESILFIGNSYTDKYNGVDSYFKACCAAATPPINVTTEREVKYSQDLDVLWNETDAVDKIQTGNYDLVVLQAFNSAQDWPRGALETVFWKYVRKFNEEVVNAGGTMVLFMHWAGNPTASWMGERKYEHDSKTLAENYDSAGAELGIPVAPCGAVWNDLINNPPKDGLARDFLYSDDIHQNVLSSGLNGYVFYATLAQKSPVGIDYTWGGFSPDATMQKAFQETAWEHVGARLQTTRIVQGTAAPAKAARLGGERKLSIFPEATRCSLIGLDGSRVLRAMPAGGGYVLEAVPGRESR